MLKPKFRTPLVWFALLTAIFFAVPASTYAEETTKQSGVVEGVLTAKGEKWIMVRADGDQEARKYVPRWIGGMPKDGGGLDKTVLAKFKELVVSSRVKVSWLFEEHLRVTQIDVLERPGDGNGSEEPAREGAFVGIVTAKGETWIAIRPDGEQESKKFFPRWVGQMPKDGGGFNKDMLHLIAEAKIGSHVRVEWVFEERLRITVLRPVE